ncbi:hypothetical protein R70723_06805 [Paenibacillus sp. FSL R7-0273]|uniref:hypothetical protein n=1 Tax=Paenibacillus sp. FSL R7-0273 TaxID=1536772 RepID=UPI0004F5BF17|nr:hypothetical protein [Paenibacillus sp. FSL R7-0273]AIQ45634.1 hypothetical protein R70723_06805 [Paenibacillus sp. FSL R7-0273]OMF95155.1 hypothetical protein BK144_06360 [Paenibacillus sp. FSL R7-0273]
MITERVLKNVHIQELKDFCTAFKVKGRSTRIEAATTRMRYTKYQTLIEEELADEDVSFSASDFDNFLFDQLYYSNNNLHYLYQFDQCSLNANFDADDVHDFFDGKNSLNFNLSLTDWDDNTDKINPCTTRVEYNDNGFLKALHILLRIDVLAQDNGPTSAFCGININFESNFVLIKFNQLQFTLINGEPLSIIKSIQDTVCGLTSFGRAFQCLNLNIISLNEDSALTTIYNMFAELSLEAEQLLDLQMPPQNIKLITDFLTSLGLSDIKEEYIEQIKAVVYQDISSKMLSQIFVKGWVFKFSFREGDHSKASSNAEKRLPVYSYKAFWQLKEIIHEMEKMNEGGFHWIINNKLENFVDVRMESRTGTIVINYYAKLRTGRKEKEDYVLRKIVEHFPEESII